MRAGLVNFAVFSTHRNRWTFLESFLCFCRVVFFMILFRVLQIGSHKPGERRKPDDGGRGLPRRNFYCLSLNSLPKTAALRTGNRSLSTPGRPKRDSDNSAML